MSKCFLCRQEFEQGEKRRKKYCSQKCRMIIKCKQNRKYMKSNPKKGEYDYKAKIYNMLYYRGKRNMKMDGIVDHEWIKKFNDSKKHRRGLGFVKKCVCCPNVFEMFSGRQKRCGICCDKGKKIPKPITNPKYLYKDENGKKLYLHINKLNGNDTFRWW